jgi:hypothetical protein
VLVALRILSFGLSDTLVVKHTLENMLVGAYVGRWLSRPELLEVSLAGQELRCWVLVAVLVAAIVSSG